MRGLCNWRRRFVSGLRLGLLGALVSIETLPGGNWRLIK